MAEPSLELVNQFCKAWERLNIEELMGYFSDDAEYQNVPMGPGAKGKDAIRAAINGFLPMSKSIEFKVLRAVATGNTVFNERVDVLQMGDKRVELPVVGVFEVRGNKIALWRDYFDLSTFTKQAS